MTERDDLIQETSTTDVFASFEGDVPAGGGRLSPARLVRRYLPAVIAFLAVVLVWEGLTRLFGVESFVLSKPSEILNSFAETFGLIWGAGMRTLFEAAGGFVIGTSLAVATSLAAAHWVGFRQGVLPLAIALNATPIAALAPIFNNWFGLTNPFSKMAVVAVVVYFPVMINTTRGLLEVDPAEMELMRSLAASPSEVTRRIRIPRALPYFFCLPQGGQRPLADRRHHRGVLRRPPGRARPIHRQPGAVVPVPGCVGGDPRGIDPGGGLLSADPGRRAVADALARLVPAPASSPQPIAERGARAGRITCAGIRDGGNSMNTSRWRRHVMWLSALAIVLAACGDGGATGGEGGGTAAPAEDCTEPDPVRLQLQWFAQSQFAGYYVALDNGFYEAQCLDVEILEGAVEIVPQTGAGHRWR